jgi:hypothetical protein
MFKLFLFMLFIFYEIYNILSFLFNYGIIRVNYQFYPEKYNTFRFIF